jgi:hypothetical protein
MSALTKAEKVTAIVVVTIALILLGQISANTGPKPAPTPACMQITPDGTIPCPQS